MSDTIYALASAPGRAGVAVVRVSGPVARLCLERLAGPLPPARRATLRTIADIDRGLVLWFPAPASYTGEDMAEFHVHGGQAVVAALSAALAGCGARQAGPGEFTRRALLAGKLDLTAAEAVADLVDARTEAQRRQALRQLGGELLSLYEGWRKELTRLLAHLEASIDFGDDDLPAALMEQTRAALAALREQMEEHLRGARRGERLREGVYATIIGAPNAGKSSLLNSLAGREVAIVTPAAGTTRDILEVQLDVGGYLLTLADTAGLREALDAAEEEGVRRALARAGVADLRVLVFAADQPEPDPATLAQLRAGDLVVVSKSDLGVPAALRAALGPAALALSTRTGSGIDLLLVALQERLEELAGLVDTPTLTRARHREAVVETVAALERALLAPAGDLCAEDVRLASRALSRITGQVGVDDLLDIIFRDFCLGK